MRFRAQVGITAYFYSIPALLYTWSWIVAPHKTFWKVLPACGWILIALMWISIDLFTYWDVEPDGLREHRFSRSKFVSWRDVSYVGPWESRPRWLNIEYTRPAPNSLPGRIIVKPRKRQQFLAEVRKFAPQAQFES